jgi:hypothetical protein
MEEYAMTCQRAFNDVLKSVEKLGGVCKTRGRACNDM